LLRSCDPAPDTGRLSSDPQGGYRTGEVAAALHRGPATLSSRLTRLAARLREEPALQRALDRLAKTIKIKRGFHHVVTITGG